MTMRFQGITFSCFVCFVCFGYGMMAWRENGSLQEKLSTYVSQCLQRVELLDFVKKDFPQYKWSIRSLDRRL